MLKSAIVTTISIASLLSISSIADARSINKKSTHHSDDRNSLHFIVKQSNSSVSKSDLNGISRAISQYYKEQNTKEMPLPQTESGACFFSEVKSLKLVFLSEDSAEVKADINRQSYTLKRIDAKPLRWSYKKNPNSVLAKGTGSILLKKFNGKWKVSVASV